jgi:uncharacterized delta-60 repeat protein
MRKIAFALSLVVFFLLAACNQTPSTDVSSQGLEYGQLRLSVVSDYLEGAEETNFNGQWDKGEFLLPGIGVELTPIDEKGNMMGEPFTIFTRHATDPSEATIEKVLVGLYNVKVIKPENPQGGKDYAWQDVGRLPFPYEPIFIGPEGIFEGIFSIACSFAGKMFVAIEGLDEYEKSPCYSLSTGDSFIVTGGEKYLDNGVYVLQQCNNRVRFGITVTHKNPSFPKPATFSVENLPLGMVATFSSNPTITQTTLELSTQGLVSGDYQLIIRDSRGQAQTLQVRVNPSTVDFGGDDKANSIAVQPDGKVILAGSGNNNFALARFLANGCPDTTFGTNGKVTTDFGAIDFINDIALQADGKIVAVGGSYSYSYAIDDCYGVQCDLAVARYNPDGSLDTSFGTAGTFKEVVPRIVPQGFGLFSRGGRAGESIVLSNGKIVITGNDFLMQRNSDGSLDTSFMNIYAFAPWLTGTIDFVGYQMSTRDLIVLPDGSFAVAGFYREKYSYSAYFFRVSPSGVFLGNIGSVYVSDPGLFCQMNTPQCQNPNRGNNGGNRYNSQAFALGLQNGKFVVAGSQTVPSGRGELAVARVNPDFSSDTTFNNGQGFIRTDITQIQRQLTIGALVIQADNKIVTAGNADEAGLLIRYLPDGGLDTSFGTGGMHLMKANGLSTAFQDMVSAQGKLLIAASVWQSNGSGSSDFALFAY